MYSPKPGIVTERRLQNIPEEELICGGMLHKSERVRLAIPLNLTNGLRMKILGIFKGVMTP
jgi:hypothetical protein